MYRCLFKELSGLHIGSEWASTRKGRIDFFIPDRYEGIELLQNGDLRQILEDSDRFGPKGKYTSWGIVQDYVIINFCHPKAYRKDLHRSSEFIATFLSTLL